MIPRTISRMMARIVAIVGSVLICFATVSQAAVVEVTVDGTVGFGPFTGATATGTITYNDELITGIADEFLTPAEGLTVSLTIFGQTFTEADDVAFDAGPVLDFLGGEIIRFDFSVHEIFGPTTTPITEPGVLGFSMFMVTESTGTSGETIITGAVDVDAAAIPVPATLPLLMSGVFVAGYYRRGR